MPVKRIEDGGHEFSWSVVEIEHDGHPIALMESIARILGVRRVRRVKQGRHAEKEEVNDDG